MLPKITAPDFTIRCVQHLKGHHTSFVRSVVLFPDKQRFGCGDSKGNIVIYSLDGKVVKKISKAHPSWVYCLSLLNDEFVLSCSRDGTVKAHRISDYQLFRTFKSSKKEYNKWLISLVSLPRQRGYFVTGDQVGNLLKWNCENEDHVGVFPKSHTAYVECIICLKSKPWIVSSGGLYYDVNPENGDYDIRLYDYEKLTLERKLRYHKNEVRGLTSICQENTERLVSASVDGEIVIWDLESEEVILALSTAYKITTITAYSSNFVVAGTTNKTCFVADLRKMRVSSKSSAVSPFTIHKEGWISKVGWVFTEGGYNTGENIGKRTLCVCSNDNTISLWEMSVKGEKFDLCDYVPIEEEGKIRVGGIHHQINISDLLERMKELEGEQKRQNEVIENMSAKQDEYIRRIDHLEKSNVLMREKYNSLRKNYDCHFEDFHRKKYVISSLVTIPPLQVKGNNDNQVTYCFLNDSFRYHISFDVDGVRGKSESQIDFSPLRILFNNEIVKNVKLGQNSVEFEIEYTKIGKNELNLSFDNIRKSIEVEVEPHELCLSKTELQLHFSSLEPSGDIIREEDSQPTDRFSSDSIIQVVIKFLNENGVPLTFKEVSEEGFEFSVKLVPDGKKKGIKGVLSRSLGVEIGQSDMNTRGEFVVCNIGEEKTLDPGRYLITVVDGEFLKKKKFEIFRIV